MSERNNVLILLALFMAIGMAATAMQIFQGSDTNEITISLNNTGNLDTPIQSITYESASRVDIKSLLDAHILSGYSDPRYYFNGDYFASKSLASIDQSATILSDYQMNSFLNYSDFPGISSSFSGMAFESNGANVPFWTNPAPIDSDVDIWFKFSTISNTANTPVSMYYTTSNPSTTSNGDDVFIQWHGAETSQFLDPVQSEINDIIIEVYGRRTGATNTWWGLGSTLVDAPSDGLQMKLYDDKAYSRSLNGGSEIHSTDSWASTLNVWYNFQMVRTGSTMDAYHDDVYFMTQHTTYMPDADMGLGMFTVSGSAAEQMWSFVRVYTATEPTWNVNGWVSETSIVQITPAQITLNSIINSTGIYGSYLIIPAKTEQDFTLNGTQNFTYTVDFTPTDLTVTSTSSILYADKSHVFNAVVSDHNTGTIMPTQPDKVKYRLVGSGNTSVSAKEFVGTSITLPAIQKGTYTLYTSVGWDNIPTWSNEISQSVTLTDPATPAQTIIDSITDAVTDSTSNDTTTTSTDVLVGAPGRIVDGWGTMWDSFIRVFKNIIHNISAVFS